MLKPIARTGARAGAARVAIVASEYNRRHVDGLLAGAQEVLRHAGVQPEIVRVPGAFEIPVVVESLARRPGAGWGALIALGVVIRGATAHADLIGEAITRALMDIAVRHGVPVIHEVLLVADEKQADARCFDPRYNRGGEAATTALAMAAVLRHVNGGGGGAAGKQARTARRTGRGGRATA